MLKKERIIDLLRKVRKTAFLSLSSKLEKELKECHSLLDLGCGQDSPIGYLSRSFYSVGVDIFQPYVEESRKKGIHNEYILADVTRIKFKPRSFDGVIAHNLLEHLPKEEGRKLLPKMESWARKKVIIGVPNGYQPHEAYDGNPYLAHKSSWSAPELRAQGFKVYGMDGWRILRGVYGELKFKPWLFWLLISDITQKVTYYFPGLASSLLAVKEIIKEAQ